MRVKSAYPIYAAAAVVLIWGVSAPMYNWAYILGALASAALVYAVFDKLIPGRRVLVENPIVTGDNELDAQLKTARETLKRFRAIAEGARDERMQKNLTRIYEAGEAITREVTFDRSGAKDVYTFFSYYLPTLDKLMGYYSQFLTAGAGENVTEGKARIEDSLLTVAQAFEKLLDKLYKNEAMDVKTDIAVMEAMLKSEGFAYAPEAREAEQQVRKGGTNV